MEADPDEAILKAVDEELENEDPDEDDEVGPPRDGDEDVARGEYIRNCRATNMWNDYVL